MNVHRNKAVFGASTGGLAAFCALILCLWAPATGVAQDAPGENTGSTEGVQDDPENDETPPDAGFVEIQKRTFREDMAVAGTPYGLHYTSWRAPGNAAAYQLVVPLCRTNDDYARVSLDVFLLGRTTQHSMSPPTGNPIYVFQWDGKDSQGQPAEGVRKAWLSFAYQYASTAYSKNKKGDFPAKTVVARGLTTGGGSSGGGGPSGPITTVESGNNSGGGRYVSGGPAAEETPPSYATGGGANRIEVPRIDYVTQISKIGVAMATNQGLGGWTLTPNHYYDVQGEVLFMGDGSMRDARPVGTPPCVFETGEEAEPAGTNWVTVVSEDGAEIYVFDADGFHLKTLDSVTGSEIYGFDYDVNRWLTSITDEDGNVTAISRAGQQITITAPFGQQTVLELDGDGYLGTLDNPAMESNRFQYASGGMLTNVVSRRGNPYGIAYDATGHVARVDFPNGGTWEFARQDFYRSNEVLYVVGGTRTTRYLGESESGRRYRRTVFGPNEIGSNIVATTQDEVEDLRTYADGTTLSITNEPDSRFGYQVMNLKKATLRMPSGLSLQVAASNSVSLADTNDLLSVVAITNRVAINGRTSVVDYVSSTRLLRVQTPEGRTYSVQFDTNDRPQSISIPGLHDISAAYDGYGRLQQINGGSGAEERRIQFAYAADGYLRSLTNTLNQTYQVFADPIGRVTNLVDPAANSIALRYDRSHKPEAIQPPGKPEHLFGYNNVGLPERYSAPTNGAATDTLYTWDVMRQLTSIRWPDGRVLTNRFDSRGLLTESQWPENKVTISNDAPTMRPLLIAATSGPSLALKWDGGLLTNMIAGGSITGTVSFAYNNDLDVSGIAFNGANVAYQYDGDGLLTNAGAMRLRRSALNGFLTNATVGTVADSRQFNGFGELRNYSALSNGTEILGLDYGYDVVGQITGQVERIGGQTIVRTYAYDAAGRLSQAWSNGVSYATYRYDANGNRTNAVVGGVARSGQYDAQDRLLSYGTATYKYDAHGTLTNKLDGGQSTAYRYDARGSLLQVRPGTNVIQYTVDPLGRRIARTKNGTTSQRFVYQGFLSPAAELNSDGSVATRFVYATRANVPDYMVRSGTTYRLVADIRGSVRLVVNAASGAVVQRLDYDEWGRVLQDTNPGFQPFGFAGGLYDSDTGLVRFGFRDYDPNTGRWLAKDPILFAGGQANLFLYCYGDPINFVDLWGLSEDSYWDGFRDGFLEGLHDGFFAAIDGFIPFRDPFSDRYDTSDEILILSQTLGGFSRDAIMTAVGIRLLPTLGASKLPGTRWINSNRFLRFGNSGHPPKPTMRIGKARPVTRKNHIPLDLFGW